MRSQHDKTELYAIRTKLGLSQVDLAAQLNVNIATIWRWENVAVPTRGAAKEMIKRLAADAAASGGVAA